VSHAPVEASQYKGEDRAFADNTAELNRQVDEGTSWSGNERNQVFLNLGKQKGSEKTPEFADFSAVGGFDGPDDSRGLVALDWDYDGDLDFITTNRTAPRVRVFENVMVKRPSSSLCVKLVGDTVNRDAVGSRVELVLNSVKGEKIVIHRTRHAGQGFLSQSGKWLHFGIPEGASVELLRVIWHGGEDEVFSGVEAGGYWFLKQGKGEAQRWSVSPVKIPERKSRPEPEDVSTVHAYLERPVPLPAIPYLDMAGGKQQIFTDLKRPTLVNLWATWCPDCVTELEEFARHAKVFEGLGVDVLALCIDVEPGDVDGRKKARKIVEKAGFSFPVGFAAEKTVELIHIAHNTPFIRPAKLPVPTSLLLGPGAKMLGVVRGVTPVEGLRPALKVMGGMGSRKWDEFSRAGEGTWIHGPDTVIYSGIAKDLMERGWLDEAGEFLLKQGDSLMVDGRKYAGLLTVMGTRFLEEQKTKKGMELLETAVEQDPEYAPARNNLSFALLQMGRGSEAVPHLKAAIKADPDSVSPRTNLARYYASEGYNGEAMAVLKPVLERGYHSEAMKIKAQVLLARRKMDDVFEVFKAMAVNEPGNPSVWVNLGKLQSQRGEGVDALASLKKAGELDPQNAKLIQMIHQLEVGLKVKE